VVRSRPRFYLFVLVFAMGIAHSGGQTPASSLRPAALSPQQILKHVAPSVMVVESLGAKGSVNTLGSGVVIAPGRVITNRHVIEDGLNFKVEHDGETWPARLIKVDSDHDLAELSAEGLKVPAVQARDSSTLAVGETVYAIGAPEGLELTISEGLISGLRDFENGRVVQTSAAISPGSSGGGLFDGGGRLVGISTFYLKGGQSLNFALPAGWTVALDREPTAEAAATSADSPAFEGLGWLLTAINVDMAGDHDAAIRGYKEALWLDPKEEEAWYYLGGDYLILRQYQHAATSEQTALRLKPTDALA
jgi:hypothetical protein